MPGTDVKSAPAVAVLATVSYDTVMGHVVGAPLVRRTLRATEPATSFTETAELTNGTDGGVTVAFTAPTGRPPA